MIEAGPLGMQKSSTWRHSGLLAELGSVEARRALQAVAGPPRSVRADAELVSEAVPCDQLYVLIEGWACRYKTLRDGSRQIVALVTPGEVANLDTLLFGCPGSSVRTLTPVTAVPIPRDDLNALAERFAGIGRMLNRRALVEAAILSQWALCLGRMAAHQRLAHLLCELKERLCPRQGADGVRFKLPLTQEQIADTLGLTAVHVNRTLHQLRAERLVVTEGRIVSLPDPARLSEVAEFDAAYLHGGRITMRSSPQAGAGLPNLA